MRTTAGLEGCEVYAFGGDPLPRPEVGLYGRGAELANKPVGRSSEDSSDSRLLSLCCSTCTDTRGPEAEFEERRRFSCIHHQDATGMPDLGCLNSLRAVIDKMQIHLQSTFLR